MTSAPDMKGLTFDMSGGPKAQPLGRPLDGVVRPGEQRDDLRAHPTYNGARILAATRSDGATPRCIAGHTQLH